MHKIWTLWHCTHVVLSAGPLIKLGRQLALVVEYVSCCNHVFSLHLLFGVIYSKVLIVKVFRPDCFFEFEKLGFPAQTFSFLAPKSILFCNVDEMMAQLLLSHALIFSGEIFWPYQLRRYMSKVITRSEWNENSRWRQWRSSLQWSASYSMQKGSRFPAASKPHMQQLYPAKNTITRE